MADTDAPSEQPRAVPTEPSEPPEPTSAQDKNMTDLEPIKNYQHVRFVDFSKNQIVDVSPLSSLPNLLVANLAGNAVAAPPVFPNAHLKSIDLSTNQLSALQGFQSASVEILKVNENQLESLAGISAAPMLLRLEASKNKIADLSALANETASKVEQLELSENQLSTLSGIENLSTLKSLVAQSNNLETMESIEALGPLENLTELDLTGNPVCETDNFRLSTIILAAQLDKLNGQEITNEERLAAHELKQQREAEAEAAAAAAEQEEANNE